MKWAIFIEDFPYMLSIKFQFFPESGFRGEDFLEINQKEEWLVAAMSVIGSGRNEQSS